MQQPPRFQKVLIANRGEIAVRIIRALREMGLKSVAVYSDADQESRHRFLADEALRLPGSTSAETYLQIPLLLDAMQRSGATAVHPGYGFLAESPQFAQSVLDQGWHFIGPTPEAMAQMGDKIAAKNAMRAVGVPVVPGSDQPLSSWQEIKTIAKSLDYPLILKAAAGGGGRGMRVVNADHELESAYVSCRREAEMYFGNPDVFCERFIDRPRHIEFQVLCDEHGNGVHLFERDCSVQRRHQKLLEEAPSVYLNATQRQRLGDLALAAAKAVGYRGAGTVEFICASPDEVYFMEMNTRIQVEHPVTECITGVDLVQEQIKVAQGLPLSLRQDDIAIRGWAIEARINVEDPVLDFSASPGTISRLNLPTNPFVRVDTHIYEGYTVPNEYDSMIAKVIAWASDRQGAIRRLLAALSELQIEGVPTTAVFHEAVLQSREFLTGDLDTGFVERFQKSALATNKDSASTSRSEDDLALEALLAAIAVNGSLARGITPSDARQRQEWSSIARAESLRGK